MAWKVLVTARAFWVSGAKAQAMLDQAGCRTVRSPQAGPVPEEELIGLLQECDAVIASSDPYSARLFESCPRLKIVSRCGVGIDSIDLDAATHCGVVATNTPGAMTEAVGDYTWALILGIARRIAEGDALMRAGGWGEYPGVLVSRKTLGLVGFGQIGQAVARRAKGFSMRVLAFDPIMERSGPTAEFREVEFVALDLLLAESDFVSIHAPAMPETRGMFNAEAFQKMKPTAYLINTARGALIDDAALIHALETGRIAGAAIDVYQREPNPADDPLRKAPNCLLTPHNAFNALESVEEMSQRSVEAILDLMRGERPRDVCNPSVLNSPALRVKLT